LHCFLGLNFFIDTAFQIRQGVALRILGFTGMFYIAS
jgi:hypothetical protein